MKINKEFTPGPWGKIENPNGVFSQSHYSICGSEGELQPVCVVASTCLEADSNLIVQAPEMYDFIFCRFQSLNDKKEAENLSIQEKVELIACSRILEKIHS